MPTPTELVDLICSETGLDSTAATADRVKALANLNRAYRATARRYNCIKEFVPVSMTSGATSKDLSVAITNFTKVDRVFYPATTTGMEYELDRGTPSQVYQLQGAGASGKPTMFAVGPASATAGISDTLVVSSNDQAPSGTMTLWALVTLRAATLTEASTEADILIDPSFHEDLLGTLAIITTLEGYEGQEERASYYRKNVYPRCEDDFKQHLIRVSGLHNIETTMSAADAWSTPSTSRIR